MSFLLSLPRPSSAWSQEVLHNATQDLVKVFICVFTNISAAGFKPHRGKDSTLMLMFMFRSSINHVIILTFLSPLSLSVSAVHPPGAASERCGRHHPLLFALVFFLLFDSHPDLRRAPGPLHVLPGHAQHAARQAGGIARGGVSFSCGHPEEADCPEQTRQRRRSASKTSHTFCN